MILIRVEYYLVLLMGAHSLSGPGYPVFVIAWYYHFYCQPYLGGGLGLRFLLYGPLELGSFYRQGMFLKFMCNIRMGNSLRPCNDRGDNKP